MRGELPRPFHNDANFAGVKVAAPLPFLAPLLGGVIAMILAVRSKRRSASDLLRIIFQREKNAERLKALAWPSNQRFAVERSKSRALPRRLSKKDLLTKPGHSSRLKIGVTIKVFVRKSEPLRLSQPDEFPHQIPNPGAALDLFAGNRGEENVKRRMEEDAANAGSKCNHERDKRIDEIGGLNHACLANIDRSREKGEADIGGRRDPARITAPKLQPNHIVQDLRFFQAERDAGDIKGARKQGRAAIS